MLDRIRSKKNSIVILAAFAAIILVFIFWGAGPGGNGDDDRNVVATVDGTPISAREYASLYKRELDYYRNTFKDQSPDEIARKLDLKNRALSILINREIALKAARKEGLRVSKEEVQAAIQAMDVFSKNGAFDKETYFSVLSSNRLNPADFEQGVEEDLLAAKVRDKIVKGVTVSDEETKDAYFKANRKVDLSYISIGAERFRKNVEVTKEEAERFLAENGSLFMLPARVKAFYSFADYAELAKKVPVTDKEIKELYDKNSGEYMTPAKVKARHILIRPEAKGAEDLGTATQVARKKAAEVLSELKAGGNFSALAKKYSKDPGSASQGGDLGWFERGVMIRPFEDAVFSMKKGETSEVVETEFGFHIIRLDDKLDAVLKPFDEVKKQIRERIAEDKAHPSAREASLAIMNRFRDAKTEEDLKKAVSDAGAEPGVKGRLTPLFQEGDAKVELVRNEMVRDVVFSMRQDEVSRLLETPSGIYVVKIVERQNPRVPEYDAVKDRLHAILTEKKALEAAGDMAKQVMERIKNGEDLLAIAKKEGFKAERTGYFNLVEGFVPRVGAFAGDRPELFALTEAEPHYDAPIVHENRFYIFRLAAAKDAPEAGFDEGVKEDLSRRLLAEKQENAVNGWFEEMRGKAKIKVFESRL